MSGKIEELDPWEHLHKFIKDNGCELEYHSWCEVRESHRKAKAELETLRAKVGPLEEMKKEIEEAKEYLSIFVNDPDELKINKRTLKGWIDSFLEVWSKATARQKEKG